MPAYLEAGQWSFVFFTNADPTLDGLDLNEDGWFDVSCGRVAPIAHPFDATGMALGQVLNGRAVWPGPDGGLRMPSKLHSSLRPVLTRRRAILVRYGRGEATWEQTRETLRADAEVFASDGCSIDEQFGRFLAALREHPKVKRHRTADDLACEDAGAEGIVQSLLWEERLGSLRGMAGSMLLKPETD